ncbi:hypothetical protein SAMN05216358_2619 [Rhizobium sp. AN5]|uniref:hypothetical protein n=1 Tax=Rhizobium sp. AN5 TaxID=1855304 RepID=UPI000BC743D4|nr:hypothetical protein [Rhizobium sp. AN5]SOC92468.1 hypothetical protein SAMN05216358_2619 [Rhizobium sp. AN5]
MASLVSTHAANIVALAVQADALVTQFRALLQSLEDEERAIYLATQQPGEPHVTDVLAGRRRLGHYVILRAQIPANAPIPSEHSKTVTQLAAYAWSPFLG